MARPYFAYGSNMALDQMRVRCAGAVSIGTARLEGWRYVVNERGVATVVPTAGTTTWGLLWHLEAHHVDALDAYEGVDEGRYDQHDLIVEGPHGAVEALVYVDPRRRAGQPRPGYQESVVTAAIEIGLPDSHIAVLSALLPSSATGRSL